MGSHHWSALKNHKAGPHIAIFNTPYKVNIWFNLHSAGWHVRQKIRSVPYCALPISHGTDFCIMAKQLLDSKDDAAWQAVRLFQNQVKSYILNENCN